MPAKTMHEPIPPEQYRYREDDWLEPLRPMEINYRVQEAMKCSDFIYYTEYYPMIKPLMKRRHSTMGRPSLLRFQLEELLYEWLVDGV